MADQPPRRSIDTSKPSTARLYDAYLDGKDNYEVDRETAKLLQGILGARTIRRIADGNRAFHNRAVYEAAAELGMKQFLDVGVGIPQPSLNTHDIAQAVDPAARVVYVDNDPIVMRHAQALLVGTPEGATDYVDADVRDPGTILEAAARTLDFKRPVAVMLVALLHFIPDTDDPQDIVERLMAPLAPGSCLIFSHVTNDVIPEAMRAAEAVLRGRGVTSRIRSRREIGELLPGLTLVKPGLVDAGLWRPDSPGAPASAVQDEDAAPEDAADDPCGDEPTHCLAAIGIKEPPSA